MATRIKRADMNNRVREIEDTAREIGLLAQADFLVWSPGSVTNGHSPEVSAYRGDTVGRKPVYADFLPEFTYKTTQVEAWRLLGATLTALKAVARRAK